MEPTRLRIVESAGQIFADKGFRGATIREICQAAGVNLASVNYHFRDKESLYIEVVRTAHERNITERPLPPDFSTKGTEYRLHAFVQNLLQRMIGRPDSSWESRLLLSEIIQPTRACEALVESSFRPQFEILLGILAELTARELSDVVIRRLGFSVVGQCLFYRVAGRTVKLLAGLGSPEEDFSIDELADHITRVSLAAARSLYQPPVPLSI